MSQEKKKPEQKKPEVLGGGGSIFDGQPDPSSDDTIKVTVSSGPYNETLELKKGISIGEVRKRFADRFDIDKQSASIVDGNPVDEAHILKNSESLMFVRHAGEKGASSIVIEGEWATAKSPEGATKKLNVATMIERATPRMDTGHCIMPNGVKAIMSRGPISLWFLEKTPCVQNFRWIANDSPNPYGSGTKYRNVRIAIPYLIIMAVFIMGADGMPTIARTDECFFRNEPLMSIHDELSFPALLNCSKFKKESEGNPLSWICTQHLKPTKLMNSDNPGDRFIGGLEAVRYCLLETGFNLSSEHHEGNSWYNASKHIDQRIITIERWQLETKKDPVFAVEVPWIKTNRSLQDIAERTFKRMRASEQSVKSANDLYRVIAQG